MIDTSIISWILFAFFLSHGNAGVPVSSERQVGIRWIRRKLDNVRSNINGSRIAQWELYHDTIHRIQRRANSRIEGLILKSKSEKADIAECRGYGVSQNSTVYLEMQVQAQKCNDEVYPFYLNSAQQKVDTLIRSSEAINSEESKSNYKKNYELTMEFLERLIQKCEDGFNRCLKEPQEKLENYFINIEENFVFCIQKLKN